MHSISTTIQGENLQLFAAKALFWKKEKALFLSDLHLGKANHFQKNGIALPNHHDKKDLERLAKLIISTNAKQVFFLGDLFHSNANESTTLFQEFLLNHPTVSFKLILGNHDIIPASIYKSLCLDIHNEIKLSPFLFSHDYMAESGIYYNIHGHIHPGVLLKGKAKQSIRTACYFFGPKHGILPAYGSTTGLHLLSITKKDRVFTIAGNQIINSTSNSSPKQDPDKLDQDS